MSEEYKKALTDVKLKLIEEANTIRPLSYSVDCDFDWGKLGGINAAIRIIEELEKGEGNIS